MIELIDTIWSQTYSLLCVDVQITIANQEIRVAQIFIFVRLRITGAVDLLQLLIAT